MSTVWYNERPRTVRDVNRMLAAHGALERLQRGRGYYYFTGGDAARWITSSVMVNRVDALTIEQWLVERINLATARNKGGAA